MKCFYTVKRMSKKAPKVKLGKFAKRNQAMRKRTQTLPGGINSKEIREAVGKAITGMTEAQYKRMHGNKVPTKAEALDMAKKVAGGLAKYPTPKPAIAVLMPHVTVKQPPPHKAATIKK